jgi:hypothetical protein
LAGETADDPQKFESVNDTIEFFPMFILSVLRPRFSIVFSSKSGNGENNRLFGGYRFSFLPSAGVEEKDVSEVLFIP